METQKIENEKNRRIRAEKTLMAMKSFLFDYFHRLGPNPLKNIDIIVETACKALSSPVGLYNRFENGVLETWSIYNEPHDFVRTDNPYGHICYDMTIQENQFDNLSAVVFEDLEGTKWEKLDSNVKKYGIKAYLGFPVILEQKVVGSICVVDVVKREYTQIERDIIEAFAKAVTLEEERKLSHERLTRSSLKLIEKNKEIKRALSEVKTLSGLLPMCASCKKIRDDKGYWNRLEAYIHEHTDVKFSHGICPDCIRELYPDLLRHGD